MRRYRSEKVNEMLCGRCKIIFISPPFSALLTIGLIKFHSVLLGMESENYSNGKSRTNILRAFHYKCNLYFCGWRNFNVGNLYVIMEAGYGGGWSVKNCQFYASTCFESLSDCRIMNQNHKIDIIQNPSRTSLSKVCVLLRWRGWEKWQSQL